MKLLTARSILFIALAAAAFEVGIVYPRIAAGETIQVFILDSAQLLKTKHRLQSNDPAIVPAFKKLIREADVALGQEIFSVVQKDLTPPSGNQHDYMSIAPYWWPNPNTADGLPYIRRDGEMNPERDQTSDRKKLGQMILGVKTLSLGYFFTGKEAYPAQASKLLRLWFLEPATQMNPHLTYAQAIPGRNQGRGAGIIETHNLPQLIDAVGLLNGSQRWDGRDHRALQDWFRAYLTWLLESPEGRAEARAQNNHGSWYDVQVASYALFTGRNDLAKTVLNEFPAKRIAKQIQPDGRQPRELQRARAWSYSVFNLQALFDAASIADKLGVDLWNYETPDQRGIRRALDWLLPFAIGTKTWSSQQTAAWQPEKLAPLLRRAANRYREPAYEKAIGKLPGGFTDERWQLLFPKTPFAD
jgi:hypothetical protein